MGYTVQREGGPIRGGRAILKFFQPCARKSCASEEQAPRLGRACGALCVRRWLPDGAGLEEKGEGRVEKEHGHGRANHSSPSTHS